MALDEFGERQLHLELHRPAKTATTQDIHSVRPFAHRDKVTLFLNILYMTAPVRTLTDLHDAEADALAAAVT